MIKIIGIGGCGDNILNFLNTKIDAELVTLQSDVKKLNDSKIKTRIKIGNDDKLLDSVLDGADRLFIVAGFGGNTGGKFSIKLTKKAIEKDIAVQNIVILPFMFENEDKANNELEELNKINSNVSVYSNRNIANNENKDKKMQRLCEALMGLFWSL
jgi:cell division protein FtsZ